MAHVLALKRVYEEPSDDDGVRVLVDRLWPRGITKERAALDLWLKEIAPSTPLRKEFGHMRERFEDFRQRYEAELDGNAAVETLLELARGNKRVTLLYGARDPEANHAQVLRDYLLSREGH
ncbi:DUF488 family protein [Arthrobacter sp. ISL-30]|nr:DUF488 family protein [Arthrobacter sp. ISL-30]